MVLEIKPTFLLRDNLGYHDPQKTSRSGGWASHAKALGLDDVITIAHRNDPLAEGPALESARHARPSRKSAPFGAAGRRGEGVDPEFAKFLVRTAPQTG